MQAEPELDVRNGRPLRANRGRNPNARWLISEPPATKQIKKRKTNKPSKPVPKQAPAQITEGETRCKCNGDISDDKVMAECEKCTTWQHIVCEFGVDDESALPKPTYLCYQCRDPEFSGFNNVREPKPELDQTYSEKNVESVKDLDDKVRRSVAEAFKSILLSFKAAKPYDADKLALSIENELHLRFAANQDHGDGAYRERFRTLSFNLKDEKNAGLQEQVASGKLSPSKLVQMSSNELRNPDLQKEVKHLHDESIRETILKPEESRMSPVETSDASRGNRDIPSTLSTTDEQDVNQDKVSILGGAQYVYSNTGNRESELNNTGDVPVWQGTLKLANDKLALKAQGVSLRASSGFDWSHFIDKMLVLEGLVLDTRALSYIDTLSQLKNQYEILALAISSEETSIMENMYDYLYNSNRVGYLQFSETYVKDAYLVPYTSPNQLSFLNLTEHSASFLNRSNGDQAGQKLLIAIYILNERTRNN